MKDPILRIAADISVGITFGINFTVKETILPLDKKIVNYPEWSTYPS